MAWLFIFPGDWHILKNYQEVLLKVYFDAGLKDWPKQVDTILIQLVPILNILTTFCWKFGRQCVVTC